MVPNENTPPLRSSQPAVSVTGFFELIRTALALYATTEGQPDGTTPILVHEFPKARFAKPDEKFDIITHRVVNSVMAPTMNDGSAPRSPKLRETKLHPKLSGYNTQIYGWWELVQGEFSVWSRSSRNADLVADWFHFFMMKYAFIYKLWLSRGVSNFRFVKRADDDIDLSFGQELYRRRLTYEFRIDTLLPTETKQLTDLDINYGVSGPSDSITLEP